MAKTRKTAYREGQTRCACECGARFEDPNMALFHTLKGHEVVLERWRNGTWQFHRKPVAEYLVESMMQKGEDVEAFTRRIEQMGEKAERDTEILKSLTENN